MKASLLILFLMPFFTCQSHANQCIEGWAESTLNQRRFCIELTHIENVKAHEAALICEEKGAKVCSTGQWVAACNIGIISTGNWEWSVSLEQYTSIVGNNDCTDVAFGELLPIANLRCCK